MTVGQFYRSYLYAPASKPELVLKALNSKADCVVVDLEDAVHHDMKSQARDFISELLGSPTPKPILVRINDPHGTWGLKDIDAISSPNLVGVRVPKVASTDTVHLVANALAKNDCAAQIHLLIESAKGVSNALAMATSNPRVTALSLGEADLQSDLRVEDDEVMQFCRNAIVVAARAAGLKQPSQSVFPNTKDLDGLRISTEQAKKSGFFGRSIIHPTQIDIVNETFTPTLEEVDRARELLEVYKEMQKTGNSVMALPNGDLLDPANIHYAQFQVAIFNQINEN